MEKYFFKTKKCGIDEVCIEPCMVKNDGTMIGSISCMNCIHNEENNANYKNDLSSFEYSWIKCERIQEATGANINEVNS